MAPRVEMFLLLFPCCRAVVRRTAPPGMLSAMVLTTAERATQVPATGASRMHQKTNPALNAARRAIPQRRMRLQDRVQRGLVLLNKRAGAVIPVPIRTKREKLLDGDGKKARLSVTMRIDFCTPSSYLVGAKASRGGTRFFLCARHESDAAARAIDPARVACPGLTPRPAPPASPDRILNHYLKEGTTSSPFQVAKQFS